MRRFGSLKTKEPSVHFQGTRWVQRRNATPDAKGCYDALVYNAREWRATASPGQAGNLVPQETQAAAVRHQLLSSTKHREPGRASPRPPRQSCPLHTVRRGRGVALPLRQRTPFPHGAVVPLDLRASLGRASDRFHPRGQPGAADQGRHAWPPPSRERRRAELASHLDHWLLRRAKGQTHQAPQRTPPPCRASAPPCPRREATRAGADENQALGSGRLPVPTHLGTPRQARVADSWPVYFSITRPRICDIEHGVRQRQGRADAPRRGLRPDIEHSARPERKKPSEGRTPFAGCAPPARDNRSRQEQRTPSPSATKSSRQEKETYRATCCPRIVHLEAISLE